MNFLHQLAHSLRQAVEKRLRSWTRPENHGLVLNAALDFTRGRSELVMENALLRQQLTLLERQIRRPQRAKLGGSLGAIGPSSFSWKASGLASHAAPVERGTDHCAA